MSSYRDLKAWQHALRLAVECSKAAKRFPIYERYVLAVQLRRAGYSVVLNIAEGSARRGARECRRFLDTARGSLAEVETVLELALQLAYLPSDECSRLSSLATETAKTLFGLLRKVGAAARSSK